MLIDEAYKNISDLNLWFKLQTADTLVLGDIPELIGLRWFHFKDNWDTTIKPNLVAFTPNYRFPSLLTANIEEFSDFVAVQRVAAKKTNPINSTNVQKRFYGIFDSVELFSLPLSPRELEIVNKASNRVTDFTKSDFIRIRASLVAARDEIADAMTGTDADYNRIYNRSPARALVDVNIRGLQETQIIQSAIDAVVLILANIYSIKSIAVDPFALAKSNANNPGFNIGSYSSGRLVKMNYGSDLMHLADRYLGNPDKWIDIAIANGLKPPYVDEVGSKIELMANGSGSQINIRANDNDGNANIHKFYVNQSIFLQSTVEKFPEKRIIVNISEIPVSNEIVLELNGDSDLEKYLTSESAHIRVYKPNTVNSSQYILIPSTDPITNSLTGEVPWFLSTSGEDERRAKVDLLIDNRGDLQFTPAGDLQLSFGIDNAIQALKLKLTTEQGSLMREKPFGIYNAVGERTNDIEALKQKIIVSIGASIAIDSRFDRLESLTVEKALNANTSANLFLVKIVVRLAGSGTNIPITFSINQN